MNNLSERLKKILENKEWSITELAKATNRPYNTIRDIVNGRTPHPRSDTLNDIAKALKMTADELTENELARKNISIETKIVAKEMEKLEEKDRKTVLVTVIAMTSELKKNNNDRTRANK